MEIQSDLRKVKREIQQIFLTTHDYFLNYDLKCKPSHCYKIDKFIF